MNKLELVEHVAKEAELSKASAAAALDAILDGIGKSLKKGDEVRLVGFGTFSVRERAACSLAESGMLTHDQRLAAVPQLIGECHV